MAGRRRTVDVRDFARRSATASLRAAIDDREVDFTAPAEFPLSVRIAKRAVDVVGATTGLVVLSPLMVGVALAVRRSSPGPVFYTQVRAGRTTVDGEQVFTMYKFRTMVSDAERNTGPVWAVSQDDRITKVGRFLRKTRMDELPQLWNILLGDMSLVGPRPERPYFTAQLREAIPGYEDRMSMLKPGLTGWAQVRCPYDSSIDSVRNKLVYDVAYAAHLYQLRTYIAMELKVLAMTPWVVLTGKGAV